MHEMSLALALVEQAEQHLSHEKAEKVLAVIVEMGVWSGVDKESFEFCYPLAAQGSRLEGAPLKINLVPVRVYCAGCGSESEPEQASIACRHCREPSTRIIKGREFNLVALEVEE